MIDWTQARTELMLYFFRSLNSSHAYASLRSATSSKIEGFARVLVEDMAADKIIREDPKRPSFGMLGSVFGSASAYVLTPTGYDGIERELAEPTSYAARLEKGDLSPIYFRYLLGERVRRKPIDADLKPTNANEKVAPAADRVVKLDHNGGPTMEIVEAVQELRAKIKKGNDLGDLTPNEIQAAWAEVGQIEQAFLADFVRPEVIMAMASRSLKWIGEKSAGAAVGKAALALLALIASFFGITN